jgi:phenylpyruvate tautomerase PptA (4-oxalocrotonate tautomerase family)
MPLLKITTNREIDPEQRSPLMAKASSRVAELLGKPESYVMVMLEHGQEMLFGGSPEPLAYLELKSIGLPRDRTGTLSAELCRLVTEELAIPERRIYIEFSDAERDLWGWNSTTFAR